MLLFRLRPRAPAVHHIPPGAVSLTLPYGEVLRVPHHRCAAFSLSGDHRVADGEAEIAALCHLALHGVPDERALSDRRAEGGGDCVRACDELAKRREDLRIGGGIAAEAQNLSP